MAKEKTTKKERFKKFVSNHKGGLIGAGVLVVCGAVYVLFDIDIDIEAIENWACNFFGGC